MGDINIDRLKQDVDNTILEEELTTHKVRRLPLPATRITHNTSTSIDFICTNLQDSDIDALVIQTGLSDHTAQMIRLANIRVRKTQPHFIVKRLLGPENLNHLKCLLSMKDWGSIHHALDAETAYSNFQGAIQSALDITCPVKKVKIKTKRTKFYYDKEANDMKNAYIKALNKYETSGSITDKVAVTETKKQYDKKLRTLQQNSNAQHVLNSDNKSKALWMIVNNDRKGNKIKNSVIQINHNNEKIDNPMTVAELFNAYFTRVAEMTLKQNGNTLEIDKVKGTPDMPNNRDNILHLTLTHTNITEVKAIINSLKSSTSSGVDDYSSKIVKYCSSELAPPLVTIINSSFTHGQFPSALKQSKVYPKHKKGSTHALENYRPISLVSTFSKIIERIVLKRLLPHLRQQNLITDSQHGFLQGKSTSSAIISLVEYIIDRIDEEQFISALFLDYSKAFDCLSHELIAKKLEHLGVKGLANKWFASYLSGRSQLVELKHTENSTINTYRTKPLPITRGVPQGSVLGPVLFILFTNNFPEYIQNFSNNTSCLMYADDTTLLINNATANGILNSALTSLKTAFKYCRTNDLAVNPNKTVLVNFSNKKEELTNIPNILTENLVKFLGVTLDSRLTWNEHINQLCKKVSVGVYVIRRIKWNGGLEAAKTAYYALIESHLRYGLPVWGGSSAGNLNRVLLLQKKAIRALTDLHPQQSCQEAFKKLGILTITALYVQEVILHTMKLNLPTGNEVHTYNTCHVTNYILPHHRTSLYGKKPSTSAASCGMHYPNILRF